MFFRFLCWLVCGKRSSAKKQTARHLRKRYLEVVRKLKLKAADSGAHTVNG